MLLPAVLSFGFATALCVIVGVGQALGLCHPNYFPSEGETLVGFYATLWSCVAFPFPILIGTLGGLQRLYAYATGR